ncbi:ferric reductase like transmembrane component-domain-containing protein [Hypoxylon trugodes]|uniref:ferric reductase like transmembrane component-domain-containing protein n=1 Tax=Hypoxylon trugodes TaxID=326681 RepID=UPI00219D1F28|nr:ferric reductase like transmembrane component-domain-containing protein [Hypoxylon trugodes]KAI1388035.1 ferric reductase like transmembrane component-domain-containing protein [Hypoxylon trugodes]
MKWASALSFTTTASLFTTTRGGHGLIGYGQWWYDPKCCYACRGVIASAPLECPDGSVGNADTGMDMNMASPAVSCISDNTAFLTTLAYCINSTCYGDQVGTWEIEKYWADEATSDPSVPPKWTYGMTLANITQAPTRIWRGGTVLNYTALLLSSDYEYQKSFDDLFDWEEYIQSTYVIIIIMVGVGTPVLMSFINYLPWVTRLLDRLKPYLIYPSAITTRSLPWLLGNMPTRGESLYITMFITLNIVLSAVSYRGFDKPHPWGFTPAGEIMAYVGYRTGHISFALLPLTVLFSSRNNFLIWLTNWPYSTFLVLHRWVARVCALQAVVHSITLLGAYNTNGVYYTDVHKPYWIWGVVATLCLVVLLFQSATWFRRASYEVFLIFHILLTVFAIAACWYHVMYWKGFTGIYEYWLYAVCATWFFDRLIRVLRVCQNGVCRATIVEIDTNNIVRVEVKGLRWASEPGYHAYAYFPTLHPLRPWENHPFSIVHSATLYARKNMFVDPSDIMRRDIEEGPDNKRGGMTLASQETEASSGVVMYIKKHHGISKYLEGCHSLPVLLDGPYRGNAHKEILKCDRVLLIGGGIGITGLLSWTDKHFNVKLAWSLRETAKPLAHDLSTVLSNIPDKEILVGERLNVDALLLQEIQAGWERIGVVVCGPVGLCDTVRKSVVAFGRKENTIFELATEAFSM